MGQEDKIVYKKIETLTTGVHEFGLDLTIIRKKWRSQCGLHGCGIIWIRGEFWRREGALQSALIRSRLELKGWEDWDNVRGTAIDANEISDLVAKIKVNMPLDVQGRFDMDAIEHEQEN